METFKKAAFAFSGFRAMVEKAAGEPPGLAGYEGTVESAIRVQFAQMGTREWRRQAFKDLLLLMHSKKCYRLLQNPENIAVLANISAFGDKFVNELSAWKVEALLPEKQLASLIKQCFAKYEVPEFMDYTFGGSNKIQMLWYVQMGRGDSVKHLSGFPVQFTGRMENIFRLTPPEFTVEQAIRRAQALAYGAIDHVAETIAWSSISRSFEDEPFRAEAIRFAAMLREEIIIDVLEEVWEYLFAMKAENAAYSLKGRSWNAVERQAKAWHLDMWRKREAENYREWDNRMLSDFTLETEMAIFKVVQLTNSVALYEEGYEMAHCVADYVYDCLEGTSAIFSLRKYIAGQPGFERLGTIELQLETKRIVQAQAKYNDELCEEAEMVMQQWVANENLSIGFEDDYEEAIQAAFVPRQQIDVGAVVRAAVIIFMFLMRILAASCEH